MPIRGTDEFIDWVKERVEEMGTVDEIAEFLEGCIERARTGRGRDIIEDILERHVLPDIGERFSEMLEREVRETELERYIRPSIMRVWEHIPEARFRELTPSEIAELAGVSESTARIALWMWRKVTGEEYWWRRR